MIIHKLTGQSFNSRKEAKQGLGRHNFEKALKNGEFIFINTEKNK